jgi:hypothetical protein
MLLENKPTDVVASRDSTAPVLQVSLRRLADEYRMRADEIENDEISAKRADPND